nr:major capsid protein [Brucella sp. 6810]
MMADQLNMAIAGLVAAIGNQPDATNDVSEATDPALSYVVMNDAHAKFGDHSGNLIVQVMNSTAYHKLIGANLVNTAQLFQAQNVRVVDILGKPVIVTDAPALYEAGTPNKLKVLSLAESAAIGRERRGPDRSCTSPAIHRDRKRRNTGRCRTAGVAYVRP